MNRRKYQGGVLVAIALLLGGNAEAVVIEYTTTLIAGDTWEYNYTVSNDMALTVDEFSIYFDVVRYADLVVTGAPADWDALVVQPDPALPDDGFYDALALGSGVATGESAGGFAVQFRYVAAGEPGEQAFDVLDPATFEVLFSGRTVAGGAVPIDAPATALLVVLGLLAIGARVVTGYGP